MSSAYPETHFHERGSNRYRSGWRKGILKKTGYNLVKVNGEPKYIKKEGRHLSGYSVFVNEWSEDNPRVEGPTLMKRAVEAWRELNQAEKNMYNQKAQELTLLAINRI